MKIVNLGSCCIDHVYHVPEFVKPGETLPCTQYDIHPGGKGLNQSIAIARAGAAVEHAGKLGSDGLWLKELLDETGVTTTHLLVSDAPSGHANIQVNSSGENAIVLFGGTNRQITKDEIKAMLSECKEGDYLVLQNEISELETAMQLGAEQGLRTVFNAAPMTAAVADLPLSSLELLIINEIEGEALSGKTVHNEILHTLNEKYQDVNILLTLGKEGAKLAGPLGSFEANAPSVDVVDTTGAGDTFTGYFIADYATGRPIQDCLDVACQAAALSVTRPGAASSIPERSELQG